MQPTSCPTPIMLRHGPQGFINGDSVFLIEPNEISGIVAAGTQNTESVLFLQALDEVMQKETIYDS